jgi:hypothetical protein
MLFFVAPNFISPRDERAYIRQSRGKCPLALAEAFITLSFCAVVASFLPARRAASIEPVKALRSE